MNTQTTNANHHLNPNTRPSGSNQNHQGPHEGYLDLSRGARRYNIRPQQLWLAAQIWEDYAEVNSALGLNVAGVILSALAGRYAYSPEGMSEGMITVALDRQRDDELVEVDLQIHRVEGGVHGSFVLVRKIGERPLGRTQPEAATDDWSLGPGSRRAKRSDEEPRFRWTFCLQDHPPGPSFGDAMEFIAGLGLDPWSFENVELVGESYAGPMAVSEFEVIGAQEQLMVLREAYRTQTGKAPAALEQCDAPADMDATQGRVSA